MAKHEAAQQSASAAVPPTSSKKSKKEAKAAKEKKALQDVHKPADHVVHTKLAQKSKDKAKVEEQIPMETKILEELDTKTYLPLLMCRDCKQECEPRSEYLLYCSYSPS